MRQVTITKLFPNHGIKSFEFEDVRSTFPSIGCSIKSVPDLKSFIEAEQKGGTNGCSIIILPLYSAQNLLNYHVLRRLSSPRHPPHALSHLTLS